MGQRVDYFFDLAGDDVMTDEIFLIKDLANQAFGEHVLNQHLVHRVRPNVGVERGLADGHELGVTVFELFIVLMRLFNLLVQTACDVADLRLEMVDCLLKFGEGWNLVVEEAGQ